MKTNRWVASILMIIGVTMGATPLFADRFFSRKGVKPVDNKVYADACGSCHMAYPAGLLPENSWKELMKPDQLEDHFGQNAELGEKSRMAVETFLSENSADKSWYKRSRKIMASLGGSALVLRISETPYIQQKHRKIPERMLAKNPKVRSMMNCNACHPQAERGSFDDDSVNIPGFGRWDD
ncbi:MAG: cytochrome C [SAR324 cluster bacterium]|nr:cytochrome C [SAR324 cluster bacterium]